MTRVKAFLSMAFALALVFAVEGSATAAKVKTTFHTGATYLFNDDTEIGSDGTPLVVASITEVKAPPGSRLLIQFSSVGAAINSSGGTSLFLGAFVDGQPAIGSQSDPGGTPGYVNVLSVDYLNTAAWDSAIDHVWFSDPVSKTTKNLHTVTIVAATGNALIGLGAAAGIDIEARDLVVTVLH
jgi:hypothetical protein